MLIAVIILSVFSYLCLGMLVSRLVFKPVLYELGADYDKETAVALGICWPVILAVYVILIILSWVGSLFGGEEE